VPIVRDDGVSAIAIVTFGLAAVLVSALSGLELFDTLIGGIALAAFFWLNYVSRIRPLRTAIRTRGFSPFPTGELPRLRSLPRTLIPSLVIGVAALLLADQTVAFAGIIIGAGAARLLEAWIGVRVERDLGTRLYRAGNRREIYVATP
jgi:hypothetical protein